MTCVLNRFLFASGTIVRHTRIDTKKCICSNGVKYYNYMFTRCPCSSLVWRRAHTFVSPVIMYQYTPFSPPWHVRLCGRRVVELTWYRRDEEPFWDKVFTPLLSHGEVFGRGGRTVLCLAFSSLPKVVRVKPRLSFI